jgi:hypothetical protein
MFVDAWSRPNFEISNPDQEIDDLKVCHQNFNLPSEVK